MDLIVGRFSKNKYEEVRVQIKEYRGKDLIDVRVWTDIKGVEEKIPTTKGVTMNISHFYELKHAILDLEKVLKENNLLVEERPDSSSPEASPKKKNRFSEENPP